MKKLSLVLAFLFLITPFAFSASTDFDSVVTHPGAEDSTSATFLDTSGDTAFQVETDGDLILGADTDAVITVRAPATFETVTSFGQNGQGDIWVLEGATEDAFETFIRIVDPTADNVITLPNAAGTFPVSVSTPLTLSAAGDIDLDQSLAYTWTGAHTFSADVALNADTTVGDATSDTVTMTSHLSGGTPLRFEGATNNSAWLGLVVTDPTTDRLITLPDASGTVPLLEADNTWTGDNTFNGDTSTFGNATADTVTMTSRLSGATPLRFEGSTNNDFGTALTIEDPTASTEITLPNSFGALILSTAGVPDLAGSIWGELGTLVFEGTSADAFEVRFNPGNPTADRLVTFPNFDATIGIARTAVVSDTFTVDNPGTESFTGAGFKPSAAILFVNFDGGSRVSWGFVDQNGIEMCIDQDQAGATLFTTGKIARTQSSSGNSSVADFTSFDADGMTITWSDEEGNPTGSTVKEIVLFIR